MYLPGWTHGLYLNRPKYTPKGWILGVDHKEVLTGCLVDVVMVESHGQFLCLIPPGTLVNVLRTLDGKLFVGLQRET